MHNYMMAMKVRHITNRMLDNAYDMAEKISDLSAEMGEKAQEATKLKQEMESLQNAIQEKVQAVIELKNGINRINSAAIDVSLSESNMPALLDLLPESEAVDLADNLGISYVPISARSATPPESSNLPF